MPEPAPPIELAAIDLAGTTVRDDGVVEAALVEALRAVGAADPDAADDELRAFVRRTMGMSKIAVFRDVVGDESRAHEANRIFEAAYARRVADGQAAAIPGAEVALSALRENGIRVAITTGFSSATRDLLLEALGWRGLVDLALSPGAGLRGRPAPDLVLAAVIRLGVDDVHAVAVVGDTTNDLVCGHRAGAGVLVGVLTGAHDRATLVDAPHTHLLDSIAELPETLLGGDREALQAAGASRF